MSHAGTDTSEIVVRRYAGDAVPSDTWNLLFALRARILRAGQPPETAHFPGDTAPETIHLAAFRGDTPVGLATLMPEAGGIRLRGMAVDTSVQKRGVGAAILRVAQEIAIEAHLELWCSAREIAVGFYERLGWVVESDVYDVPGIGPHYQMRWRQPHP